MLNIHYIEQHLPKVLEQLTLRNMPDTEKVLTTLSAINKKRKEQQGIVDDLRHTLHQKTAQIATALQEKNQGKIDAIKLDIAMDKKKYKVALEFLKKYQENIKELLVTLPNLPEEDVPIGKEAKDNQIVSEWQGYTNSHAKKAHWDLIETYDIIDFNLGNKITGAGFPVYKKEGARLQRALINFFLDEAVKVGYQEISPPIIVNENAAFGTGQLPDKEGMMYALQEKGLYLIPTAEVPLTNLYQDNILASKDLPIKIVGYTPCFRREAGSWGRHVRGLNRLHQFDKVEIIQIVAPEEARNTLQTMCDYVGSLLQKLGLTYRILKLCTGDLGFSSAITYDFEVWASGQQQWLEVSSVSCFNDYQARRMHLRYKTTEKPKYCYTLNGSALALPRIIATLLENYQHTTHIDIPKVLHPYTQFEKITQ